ncbi:MAG: thiamine pyrophosphate-binding protein, partial [Alcaligenes sp.]
AAVHAADAYSRSSQKVGVALVTSGPGVTNAVTGIATAYLDSIPMVIISGQVSSQAIGEDAFQECDTVGITRPCVKHNFLVRDVRELADTIRKAFYIATTGRPGPVLIDIPKDITTATCKYTPKRGEVKMRSYSPVTKGHQGQIKKAVQMLNNAERPLIYVGGGVVLGNASDELNELVKLSGAPCTTTLMGLGAYPGTADQYIGMPGMHGTYEANMTMQHCSQNPRKIIHIDIDPSVISKRVKVDVPIVGGVKDVLQEFNELFAQARQDANGSAPSLNDWWKQINVWRGKDSLAYAKSDELIKPQYV